MAPHSSALAWKIPWTEEPGRLRSMQSLGVGHDWATSLSLFTFMHWRRKWHPTPVLLPGKSHGQRSLVDCGPWGHEESDTTERLHFHVSLSCIGEGNGNPLQCSWLENPRDEGAWWAAVCGVTRSHTLLKWLSSSSSFTWEGDMIKWKFLSYSRMCYFAYSGFTYRFHFRYFPQVDFFSPKKHEISISPCLMINLSLLCFITQFGIYYQRAKCLLFNYH